MDNKYELEGKVYAFGELKEFESGYKKRDLLVEVSREYNDKVYTDIIRVVTDRNRVDSLSVLSVGDQVQVGFSLSGRMWKKDEASEERNFTDLKAIWVQKIGGSPQVDPTVSAPQNVSDLEEDVDDLPF